MEPSEMGVLVMSHEPSVIKAAELPTYEPAPGAKLQVLTGEEHR